MGSDHAPPPLLPRPRRRPQPLLRRLAQVALVLSLLPAGVLPRAPGHQPHHDPDYVYSTCTSRDRVHLAQASRAWRPHLRTVIAVDDPEVAAKLNAEVTAPAEVHHDAAEHGRSHLEHYVDFPNDGEGFLGPWFHGKKRGDSRCAMAPFMAHRHFGETYKWMFFGDDDTVFFLANAKRMLQRFDPELPWAISDRVYFKRCIRCDFNGSELLPELHRFKHHSPNGTLLQPPQPPGSGQAPPPPAMAGQARTRSHKLAVAPRAARVLPLAAMAAGDANQDTLHLGSGEGSDSQMGAGIQWRANDEQALQHVGVNPLAAAGTGMGTREVRGSAGHASAGRPLARSLQREKQRAMKSKRQQRQEDDMRDYTPACPNCTQDAVCKNGKPCVGGRWYGGSGIIFSVGLLRAISYDWMLSCLMTRNGTNGGDAIVSDCLPTAGYAYTDPGFMLANGNKEDFRVFMPGWPDRSYLDNLPLQLLRRGKCNELCRYQVANQVSLHLGAARVFNPGDVTGAAMAVRMVVNEFRAARQHLEAVDDLAAHVMRKRQQQRPPGAPGGPVGAGVAQQVGGGEVAAGAEGSAVGGGSGATAGVVGAWARGGDDGGGEGQEVLQG